MTVFTMHKLRKGADIEEFKRWSREVDREASLNTPVITKFDVYFIEGPQDDSKIFDVIEVFEVTSWQEFRRFEDEDVEGSEEMKEVNKQFMEWVEPGALVTLYGENLYKDLSKYIGP